VCSSDLWIGNSALVAKKNYLQVTDDHFDRACQNLKPEPKKTIPYRMT
jgi:hypothetical protein